MKTVLIMGASGVFGTRLAQHLAHHSDFKLILAARSAAPLKALAATLPGNPQWRAFDRTTAPLNEIKPWAVVDCSGPFQTTSYDFAKACIVSGAHFVDLADAKDYLAGFSTALDAQAKANQVTALSGASSTPALSSAVVTALSQDWQQIDTVDIAITPGGKSVVGRAVIQAIMSYAGLKIAAYDNGTHCTQIGWKGATHLTIPGLGARLVSPVETFDIPLLADRVRSRITFSAGLESWIEHRGLNTVAWLRSHGLFPNPTHFLSLFLIARCLTRLFTSDTGGMHVRLSGLDATGTHVKAVWTLIAKQNQGLFVPIMAAAAALENILTEKANPGARITSLPLAKITAQMRPYAITFSAGDLGPNFN